jgi:hypothetical protein
MRFAPEICVPVLKKSVKFLALCKNQMFIIIGIFKTVYHFFPTFSQKNPVRALQVLFLYDLSKFHSIYAQYVSVNCSTYCISGGISIHHQEVMSLYPQHLALVRP